MNAVPPSPGDRVSQALPRELDPRHVLPASRGTRRPGRAVPRPRASHRVAKVFAAAVSVVVFVASGVLWGTYRKFAGQVVRIAAVPSAGNHNGSAGFTGGMGQNILLVGNSSRAGLSPAQLKDVATQYDPSYASDTILVLHVPAGGQRASLISFPRDSYVSIPGFRTGKINAAYVDGACNNGCSGGPLTPAQHAAGAQELIKTISALTGLRIDHYVEVNLFGFYQITKVLGGVQVCLNHAVKDHYSGINLPAGRQMIEGTQALAFVRQRHGLPRGDLDRIVRQQVFLGAVIRKVLSVGTLLNPIKLDQLINAVSRSLIFDKTFDPLKFANQMRSLAAGNVAFRTVPVKDPNAYISGIGDVVVLDKAALPAFINGVAQPATSPPHATMARHDVKVQVLNGWSIPGLAGQMQAALAHLGFAAIGAGNADRSTYQRTLIRYNPTQAGAARTLATVIPTATLSPDTALGGTLQLVLGANLTATPNANPVKPPSPQPRPRPAPAKGRTAVDTGCIN